MRQQIQEKENARKPTQWSRGDQGAKATATEENAEARNDQDKDDSQSQERPRSEDEPQAEAKSQDSEGINCGKMKRGHKITEMSNRPMPKSQTRAGRDYPNGSSRAYKKQTCGKRPHAEKIKNTRKTSGVQGQQHRMVRTLLAWPRETCSRMERLRGPGATTSLSKNTSCKATRNQLPSGAKQKRGTCGEGTTRRKKQ